MPASSAVARLGELTFCGDGPVVADRIAHHESRRREHLSGSGNHPGQSPLLRVVKPRSIGPQNDNPRVSRPGGSANRGRGVV
jgi:hypothetical protein